MVLLILSHNFIVEGKNVFFFTKENLNFNI